MDNEDIACNIRDKAVSIGKVLDNIDDTTLSQADKDRLTDIYGYADQIKDDSYDIEDCSDNDCECDELDELQANDIIEYKTNCMLDEQLMSALSEILKRSTVLAVTQLLESN